MADDVTKKQEEAQEILEESVEMEATGGDAGYRENLLNSMFPKREPIASSKILNRGINDQFSPQAVAERAKLGRSENAKGLPVSQNETFKTGYIHSGNKPGASGAGGPGRVSESGK